MNPAKYQFELPATDFLGHYVFPEGAVPLPSKIKGVTEFPQPSQVASLQEFLEMGKFYNCFIPQAAHLMHPLYEALRGRKASAAVDWMVEMLQAFAGAKAALANAALLAHPLKAAPFALTTDASDYALGVVFEQWVENAWQPLPFFSKNLCDSERKYSTFDRELLAHYLAIPHFRFLLESRDSTAFVDHKPLTFAMTKAVEPWSTRQQRHLSGISEFSIWINIVFIHA